MFCAPLANIWFNMIFGNLPSLFFQLAACRQFDLAYWNFLFKNTVKIRNYLWHKSWFSHEIHIIEHGPLYCIQCSSHAKLYSIKNSTIEALSRLSVEIRNNCPWSRGTFAVSVSVIRNSTPNRSRILKGFFSDLKIVYLVCCGCGK
jgi:hypothetical protein